jgi:hypothetical protein
MAISEFHESTIIEVKAYFGFDYRNFNDTFQEYHGDPLGPIVGIWKTVQYSGKKPNFKDCGEEPKYAHALDKYRINTPEYEVAEKNYTRDRYNSKVRNKTNSPCLSKNLPVS